jgi:hypothetical protein
MPIKQVSKLKEKALKVFSGKLWNRTTTNLQGWLV